MKLETIEVNINDLLNLPNNTKIHTVEQIQNIKNSIKEFGFNDPLAIWQDEKLKQQGKYYVVTGNGTLEALKELNYKTIQCNDLSNLNKEEMRAYAIAHNATTLKTGFDLGILELEVNNLNFNFSDFGLDTNFGLNTDVPRITIEEEKDFPMVLKNLVPLNKGDVFEIGRHRLIYGDSTDKNDIAKLMNGKLANMIFTDPPYNLDAKEIGSIASDEDFVMGSGEMTDAEFTEFLQKIVNNLYDFSVENSIHYICMDWRHITNVMTSCMNCYDKFKALCVWKKHAANLSTFYQNQHELIFVFQKGTGKYTRNFSIKNYRTNVWEYPGQSHFNWAKLQGIDRVHPTMKPIQLIADAIQDCSNENDIILDLYGGNGSTKTNDVIINVLENNNIPITDEIILDLFGGSGSTMVAAHQTGRIGYLSELDEKYVNVIIRRMLLLDETLKVFNNGKDMTEDFRI